MSSDLQYDCNSPSISANSSGLRPIGSALASAAGMPIIRRPALTATRTAPSPPSLRLRLRPRRLAIAAPPARASCVRLYSVVSYTGGGDNQLAQPPFRFETGIGLFAKRAPRPFPPPFTSPPSASFSDPLSTHHQSRDRRAFVNGELIKGFTNGDDAVYASDFFICANDGVGAWAARPRGHAGLWSRLILHFWAAAIEESQLRALDPATDDTGDPDPISMLQTAFEQTQEATVIHDWQGTTTACGAQLHYRILDGVHRGEPVPVLYVTNLGDGQVMVLRPKDKSIIFKTTEQWHWFDCPRQLGTNSPDTPKENAVTDVVELQVGDVVLAMSDGVIDNLWDHEIVDIVTKSMANWQTMIANKKKGDKVDARLSEMRMAAQDLVAAAKTIALDPFAESPFMEHAIEEGLASEGGKMDDISVVAALCVENR